MQAVRVALCLSSVVVFAGACGGSDGGDASDAAVDGAEMAVSYGATTMSESPAAPISA